MAADLEPLRRELAEAEEALRRARLKRAVVDEADAEAVAAAEDEIRLCRAKRDLAAERPERAGANVVVLESKKGTARALRIRGNGRDLIRLKMMVSDRQLSVDVTPAQAAEVAVVIRRVLETKNPAGGDQRGLEVVTCDPAANAGGTSDVTQLD